MGIAQRIMIKFFCLLCTILLLQQRVRSANDVGFNNAMRPAITEDPFKSDNLQLYLPTADEPTDSTWAKALKGAQTRLSKQLRDLSPGKRTVVEELYQDGMLVTPIGLNLSAVARKRGQSWLKKSTLFASYPAAADPGMDLAMRLLLSGVDADDNKCLGAQWARDTPSRYPLPQPHTKKPPGYKTYERGARRRRSPHKAHWKKRAGRMGNKMRDFKKGLDQDGFVFYDHILDSASAAEVWEEANKTLSVDQDKAPEHRALEHVLHPIGLHHRLDRLVCHEALRQLAKQYLGSGGVFESMRLQRLDAGQLPPSEHPEVEWHHSGMGRKLIVILFLDDEHSGRGIDVVQSSHQLHYYTTKHRHFSDETVQKLFPDNVIRLSGRAGSALLLDGNVIWRDAPEAAVPRDAVILEFVDWGKYELMSNMGCSQMNATRLEERAQERELVVQYACPHAVHRLVQRGLKHAGLDMHIGVTTTIIGIVLGGGMILLFAITQLEHYYPTTTDDSRERRRQLAEKGLMPRRKQGKSIQDVARRRNAALGKMKGS